MQLTIEKPFYETDRMLSLADDLQRLGAVCEVGQGVIVFQNIPSDPKVWARLASELRANAPIDG